MGIDRLIRKLLPRQDKFLALFVLDVENLTHACSSFRGLFDAVSPAERIRIVKEVEDLEHRGDEITHEVFSELGRSFITPYDREDIAGLASSLDDIMDHIDRAATSIHLYQITEFDDSVRDLAEIIQKSVAELHRAIPLLSDLRSAERIRESSVRINAYENQADGIFQRALARLFQEETDAISLIKKRELLSVLEAGTDRCEDAAVLIENILVKYA